MNVRKQDQYGCSKKTKMSAGSFGYFWSWMFVIWAQSVHYCIGTATSTIVKVVSRICLHEERIGDHEFFMLDYINIFKPILSNNLYEVCRENNLNLNVTKVGDISIWSYTEAMEAQRSPRFWRGLLVFILPPSPPRSPLNWSSRSNSLDFVCSNLWRVFIKFSKCI
jgi:hypothetical protein